jgi:hypothetical protein
MWHRALFVFITGFFITMNVLLWRSEFGGHSGIGSGIPVENVWHKMVLAPDTSRLDIRYHGKKIGYGNWEPKVGESVTLSKQMLEEFPPEGMAGEVAGYTVDFSGNLAIDNLLRLRFSFDLKLSTNQQWQEMSLHIGMRPSYWDLRASAADQTVKFISDDENGHKQQTFTFSDLQSPDKLVRLFGGPFGPGMLAAVGLSKSPGQLSAQSLGLKWQARNDWLKIGNERMRIYRLQARLLDRFPIVICIGLEGQILRVELPDDILLLNDQLSVLQ